MKKFLLLFLLFPTLLMAQTSGFTLTGKIEGLVDGEASIMPVQNKDNVIAKAPVKGGVFTLKGSLTEPGLYWLVMGKEQPVYIFLENKPISVTGSRKNLKTLKIEGSQSHKDFEHFRTVFDPLFGELNAVAAQLQEVATAGQRDTLKHQYDSVIRKVNDEVGSFVAARNSSYVSLFLLSVTTQINEDVMLTEQRYLSLDEKLRNSPMGKSLGEYIAQSKIGALGTNAIEFVQNDTAGNPVSLSSFKGKYVLVDFWASWCRPCRQENPNVVAAYNKFKDKNFTVLGVSLDQEKEAWVKAIEKDGLSWTQVSDLKFWSNEVARLYNVSSIPTNMLIDPNGKIIARDLRGADLEARLCQLLGCN